MNRKIKFLFALCAALVGLSGNVSAQKQTKPAPKSVSDFYLLLPAREVGGVAVKNRKSFVAVEDAPNGYLKLVAPKGSDDWANTDWMEIALFKKSNGEYVVGITSVGCTETCSGGIEFLEYRADRFVDVTDAIYPLTREIQYQQYLRKKRPEQSAAGESTFSSVSRLPREGKIVRVAFTGEKGKELGLFEMTWNGKSFIPNEPFLESKPSPALSIETSAAAEKSWSAFLTAFRRAVQTRDRAALKKMLAKNVHYDCCDEGYGSDDLRLALFERLDADENGWRDFDRELSETFVESRHEDVPVRYAGKVVFEYRVAEKRWLGTSYIAAEMP